MMFHNETFTDHTDYMTPKQAWQDIKHLIPKYKVIWEAFYGDGQSGKDLTSLGFNVIHEEVDFFNNNLGEIIVSNPPFSKAKEIMKRLRELEKPFILILPASKICTSYVRENFKDCEEPLQIVIPKKRIHFLKKVDGVVPSGYKSSCNFDCFYYCWKIGLTNDITWLSD